MSRCNVLSNDMEMDEIVESDIELDNSEVVDPDDDQQQKMGDPFVEVSDENREASQASKAMAMGAILEGKLDEAIRLLTEAITLNPKSPILYATRASVFVKLKKPNAAIRDADAALKMNADYAKGYKARGMARAQLGLWKEAAKDLRMASDIDFDFDEATVVILRKVESNIKIIEEHHRKYERLRKEKELRKIELEKKRRQDAEVASVLKDGGVIGILSANDLKVKLNAASKISRLTVIYFTATWSGPCRYLSPAYSSLAAKYPNVVFLKVDIEMAMEAAFAWKVSFCPCFFFVKNGKEIDKYIGTDKNTLEQKIAQHAIVSIT